MEINNVMLLSQLVNQLRDNADALEKAYNNHDKQSFDSSKNLILELHKKISYVIKK